MSETFDPQAVAVVIPVDITGPARTFRFRFVVDTGSTLTVMRPSLLQYLGYDPNASGRPVSIRSATGGGRAFRLTVSRIETLNHLREDFSLLAHELPPAVTVDGLLGLDFFRGLVLTLDFARGRIDLTPPRRWWPPWR